jgi:hypothetical protein
MNDRRRFLTGVVAAVSSFSALAAGNAEKGKNAYVQHGCWQCHGQKAILSDADLDIHAYLQSIPADKDYKSIPLLNP